MDNLLERLQWLAAQELDSACLSAPRASVPLRLPLRRLQNGVWQAERRTGTQARHSNLKSGELASFLHTQMQDYSQLTAWGPQTEYALRVTKKGKILFHSKPAARTAAPLPKHDRTKPALLPEGTAIPPLVDMGIFTPDGRVVKGMYAKYRQINRFLEQMEDTLADWNRPLSILDFGCGKSYLTFIMYYYFTEIKGISVRITGLDLKTDVVSHCNATAKKYGYAGLHFEVGDIAEDTAESPVDMVVTLHACDTATD